MVGYQVAGTGGLRQELGRRLELGRCLELGRRLELGGGHKVGRLRHC